MMAGMFALRHNLQISKAVVRLNVINVMNSFTRQEFTADLLFHKKAVLTNVNSVDKKEDVPTINPMPFGTEPMSAMPAKKFARFSTDEAYGADRLFSECSLLATPALTVSVWWNLFRHGLSIPREV